MDILITRRLTLRPPLEVDAEAIAIALANKRISRNLSRVPAPYTLADADEWIAKCGQDKKSLHFTIHRDRLIGVVSVGYVDGQYNLGYWLDEQAWGEGLMSEAARAVVSHAFRQTGAEEILSGAYVDNPASKAILDKLGFEPSHQVDDPNPTRGTCVTCNKVRLSRRRFESIFGTLEERAAA